MNKTEHSSPDVLKQKKQMLKIKLEGTADKLNDRLLSKLTPLFKSKRHTETPDLHIMSVHQNNKIKLNLTQDKPPLSSSKREKRMQTNCQLK